ncbi:MAG: lytic transglycosylase domain-containing protein [Elusimicrobiota bacterium]
MKTWMLFAAAALAPLSASAQLVASAAPMIQANENSRVELFKDIEAARVALLPQAEPLPQVTVRFQPRLDDIKVSIDSAKTPADLIKAQKDLGDWKTTVLHHLHAEAGNSPFGAPSYETFSTQKVSEMNFVMGLRQRLADESVRNEAAALSRRSGSWSSVFDNASAEPSGADDGAVRAPAPLAANDPARYAKIRALLLSKGVSPKIVDTAIAEGIRQKVDPMIVLSVINQESNFKKNAYNTGSGCTGLMQLAPATAADMGVRGNLYDPVANIKAGVKYMNWIANSFFKMNLDMSDLSKVPAEKLKMVLASYNWGIGNVQRIVRKYGTAGLDRVAPKETRNYIAEIPSRIYNWFASF